MNTLTEPVFKKLRELIYERCGIYIPDNKMYLLENRLKNRLDEKKLNSFEDYYMLLKYNSDPLEQNVLFDKITTNETCFYREPIQLELLTKGILPQIIEKNKVLPFKIWSAACSTGEEAYTIAMMIKDDKTFDDSRFNIYGTDLSEAAIISARAGKYGQYAVRNLQPHHKARYLTTTDNVNFEVTPQIKSCVTFAIGNLMDERTTKILQGIDVIFCRNVLIYFDDKAKQKVIKNLYDALKPGGYLFIGVSETLHNVTKIFRPTIINRVIVYQK
jgi:chemotaxis protein methyltransferase CheR